MKIIMSFKIRAIFAIQVSKKIKHNDLLFEIMNSANVVFISAANSIKWEAFDVLSRCD